MNSEVKNKLADIRRIVRKYGGTLEKDGVGGYEAVAPEGHRWTDAEVTFYPIPLNEAESAEERQDMLRTAAKMLSAGVISQKV